ncbi:MAG: hypothetical protein ACJ8AH_00505, partial [Stellaceae bacterium]
MIRRPAPALQRIVASALAVSAPSLIVVVALAGYGFLEVPAALAAGALILATTVFVVGRSVGDLRLIRAAVDSLRPDHDGQPVSRRFAPRLSSP